MISGVYIPQIDGKDLWLTNYMKPNTDGYSLLDKNGNINKKRYKAVFDYSLDLIQLQEIYKKTYRNNRFCYTETENGLVKSYTSSIINVTFKYSVKEWNRIGKDNYIKVGYNPDEIGWRDNIGYCTHGGQIVGVHTGAKVSIPQYLDKVFEYDKDTQCYTIKPNVQSVQGVEAIRKRLYTDGFYCNGVHYVRWKRSSGSARVGKCLFIDEKLYHRIHNWEMNGLEIYKGDKVDLAAIQAYISLTSSSIVGLVDIKPENILMIEDFESVFHDKCVVVDEKSGELNAYHDNAEITNNIWDGQSLIDPSVMGNYSDKGMILLRNRFFKSCAFNCNVQQFFADNGITDVSQLNGKTRAKKIEDVKLITTPSSIKYLKFGTLDKWLDQLETSFGVVKYEKPTHYLGGKLVSTHYQLLNSIQLERDDIQELLKPTFNFLDLCRDDPAVLKHWIKYKPQELTNDAILYKTDVIYKMMSINERFYRTKLYDDFKMDFIRSFINDAKNGHILVHGNYSVLCGNPIEMLYSAIGRFSGERIVDKDCVYSTKFEWGKVLLGSRSPHITASNVLLTINQQNEYIDKYMNTTNEIVYVNSIEENILQRLAGADYSKV